MVALTASRNTPERTGEVFDFGVRANVRCFQGALAVLNGGYAAPGTAATGLVAIGRFEAEANNTGGAAGAMTARVKRGIFRFANSAAADLISAANVGADCFIVNDQTVALTNGTNTRSRAGRIVAVDGSGVWVQIGLGW
ncbi:MAG: hypothetical protein CTY18_02940 [Methylomonas sp.]|nr:MAG: hypothetical protein CTY18_02940 [Methylomonas sp.]